MWAARQTLVERWWNRRYGSLGRKEVRLFHEVAERWTVEVAVGEIDHGRVNSPRFDSEQAARDYLTRCRNVVPDTDWTSLGGSPAAEPR